MKRHVRLALGALASAAILPVFAADHPAPVLRLHETSVNLAHLLDPVQGKHGARQVNTTASPVIQQSGEVTKHETGASEDRHFKVVPFKAH